MDIRRIISENIDHVVEKKLFKKNINKIITEAIDTSVLNNYASQLEQLVGTTGITLGNFSNNPNEVQEGEAHAKNFNIFSYNVIMAIRNGLVTSTNVQQWNGGNNYFHSNAQQMLGRDVTDAVNGMVDTASQIGDITGFNRVTQPIFNGAAQAFKGGYGQTKGTTQNLRFNQDSFNYQRNAAARTNGGSGQISLDVLFDLNGTNGNNPVASYNALLNENQQLVAKYGNGIQNIGQLRNGYQILNDIKNTVTQIINNNNNGNNNNNNNGNNNNGNNQQQTNKKRRLSYKVYLRRLYKATNNGIWLNGYLNTINSEITDPNIHRYYNALFVNTANLCVSCIKCLNSLAVQPKDKTSLNNLMEYLSVSGHSDKYFKSIYSAYSKLCVYNKKYMRKFTTVNSIMKILNSLHNDLEAQYSNTSTP